MNNKNIINNAKLVEIIDTLDLDNLLINQKYDDTERRKVFEQQVLIIPNPINTVSETTEIIYQLFESEGISTELILDQNIKKEQIKFKLQELRFLLETQIKTLELRQNIILQEKVLVDKYLKDLKKNIDIKLEYFEKQDLDIDQLEEQIKEERKFINRLEYEFNKQHKLLNFNLSVPDSKNGINSKPNLLTSFSNRYETKTLPAADKTTETIILPSVNLVLPILIYANNHVVSIGTNLIAAWLYDNYIKCFIEKSKKLQNKLKTNVIYEFGIREEKLKDKAAILK